MRYKHRMIAFSTVIVLTFLLGGCVTTEKKGMPVKEYQASQEVVSPEEKAKQTAEIKNVEDDNTSLETGIYAKEKLIETRLNRLENLVKTRKLDNLLGNIQEQESKVK